MIENTFMIRTGPQKSDVKPFAYEEEFTLFDHVWVVHRRFLGIGFTVSHKETGFRLPGIDRGRAVEAKHHAVQFLTEKQAQIPGLIAKANA